MHLTQHGLFKMSVYLAMIGIGVGIGYMTCLRNLHEQPSASTIGHTEREGRSEYINPLLECELFNEEQMPRLKPIKSAIQKLIEDEKRQGNISEASLYFRGLNRGRWFGIEADKPFTAASLTKVPILMAFYKAAEENPTILNEALAFTQEIRTLSLEQTIAPKNRLVVGQLYTVNDLLSRMIIDSDNEATSLLIANTDQAFLDRVFKDLHLPIRRNNQQETILSPEILSTFFRVLYNASYLNRPFSNEALSLLAKADFTQGIQAGVPTDIQVAHKFGERIYTNAQNHSLLTELHDCGIVYHPTNPYFLCIMTKGASVETQKKTIQNLSSLVYQKMDTFWKEEAQNRSSSQ